MPTERRDLSFLPREVLEQMGYRQDPRFQDRPYTRQEGTLVVFAHDATQADEDTAVGVMVPEILRLGAVIDGDMSTIRCDDLEFVWRGRDDFARTLAAALKATKEESK